ncbi:hypothetical protein F4825DRAFT_431758 [Nemania diffusa]|nr:hypothetical protein F4825DRAFT_431758 [Nemania diffusa]
MVLCRVPDLPTLRALVRASPILHAQYRHDRDEILRACLSRELEGLFVDAWANIESRVCTLGPRNDGVITSYIAYYRTWLSSPTPYPDVNSIKGGRLRWMAAYHLAIARPMALLYSNWALTNLKKTILSSTSQQGPGGTEIKEAVKEEPTAQTNRDIKLSRSEEIRIFRALYRYETFQHLFGINEGKRKGRFSSHEINYLFFSHFGPWETDAIGCIHTFVTHKYEDIFNQVKADLPHTHARSKQKNGTPDPYDPYDPFHAYDLEAHHDLYMDGTISRGLKMAARLFAIDDHEKLVLRMRRCITPFFTLDASMRMAFCRAAQAHRRDLLPNSLSARDEAEQRRDSITFVGDSVPPDGPPFAWVALWGGKYSNVYGDYVPHPLRKGGYVMWDRRRWSDMGAGEDFIVGQWKTSPEFLEDIECDYSFRPVDA